jgi:hypothetical protein
MEALLKKLSRKPQGDEALAMGVFVAVIVVAIWRGAVHTLLAALAAFLIVIGLKPRSVTLAFLMAALAILLFLPSDSHAGYEGFTDASGAVTVNPDQEGDVTDAPAPADVIHSSEEAGGAETDSKPRQMDGFDNPTPIGGNKPMVPDNRERREPLVLGKPYKLPSEKDDPGMHLDAGTTFLNAYKALKPDQISSMTRDTQELIATQKSLVAMLDSFGPMLKDMNKITGFFGGN